MCGCSRNAPVVYRQLALPDPIVDEDCGMTKEALIARQEALESNKTPQNFATTNAALGLISTMLNSGKYCMYNVF